MEEFSVDSFVAKPLLQSVKTLKKSQLQLIALHYKLPTTSTIKREELRKLISEYLVDEELVPEDELDDSPSPPVDANLLELKRLEFQEREWERENQLRLRELEIQEKELSVQLKLKELEKTPAAASEAVHPSPGTFDVSKHIRFMPLFQEKEVDKYFLHFEKVATSLNWPKGVWMLLLQSVLVGKAREVYSAMSVEQSLQYDHVKKTVLKAYKLVPEVYRQNFRNCKRQDKQTYTEFAREKEALFDRWCASKEVSQNFEKLRQLVLVEEFKSCLPSNIKTYIDKQKANSLQQAAVLADDYSLTHRSSFVGSNSEPSHGTGIQANDASWNTSQATRGQRKNTFGGPICNYCKR